MTTAERQRRLDTFRKGCGEALRLLYGPTPTEQEQREAARSLGREGHLPDPQDELPLGPSVA
jgi:hypothetical protein